MYIRCLDDLHYVLVSTSKHPKNELCTEYFTTVQCIEVLPLKKNMTDQISFLYIYMNKIKIKRGEADNRCMLL